VTTRPLDVTVAPATAARCILCAGESRLRYRKPPARYWECRGCGLVYQHPLPEPAEMAAYAEAEYADGVYQAYIQARALKYATFRQRMTAIRRHRPPAAAARLLDVGCACGYLIDVALEAGYDAHGVEFARAAIERASPAARPRITQGNVDRITADELGRFDVVTAFDIVEHSLDPVRFLTRLHALLRPGGLLALTTPDTRHGLRYLMGTRWPMLQPLQHTFLFDRHSIRLALERAGFTLEGVGRATKSLTLHYLAGQIEEHNPRLYRCYRALARWIPASLRERPVHANIGEMLVLASRRP
jgi:SAM-dependent methyltransferase